MDETIIVCNRRGQLIVVPGTVTDKCAKCGSEIVVSPSSKKIAKRLINVVYLCMKCVPSTSDQGAILPIQPEQIPEIKQQVDKILKFRSN